MKILAPFLFMFGVVGVLMAASYALPPAPVQYVGYFSTNPTWVQYPSRLQFFTPVLPQGSGYTSITIRLEDWAWRSTYDVDELSGQAPGAVTFNAPQSYLGARLIGPDGTAFPNSRTLLAPFYVGVAPGGSYVHSVPYDQASGTQQVPAIQPIEFTVPIPRGFCERPTPDPVYVNSCLWTVSIDASRILTQYTSGQVNTTQSLITGGTYRITFN